MLWLKTAPRVNRCLDLNVTARRNDLLYHLCFPSFAAIKSSEGAVSKNQTARFRHKGAKNNGIFTRRNLSLSGERQLVALFARRSEQSSGCAALYPPPADSKLPIKFSRDRSGCMALQTASSSVCQNELTTALSAPFGCYPHGAGAEKCTRFVYNSTCPRARAQSTGPPQNRRFGGALTNHDASTVASSKQNAGGVGEPRPALTNEATSKRN